MRVRNARDAERFAMGRALSADPTVDIKLPAKQARKPRRPPICIHCRQPLGEARLVAHDPERPELSGHFHTGCYTTAWQTAEALRVLHNVEDDKRV